MARGEATSSAKPRSRGKQRGKAKRATPAPRRAAEPEPLRDPAKAKLTAGAGNRSMGFPVVGIGASAGGLEALERLLRNVPRASGMSFVVVQHLDPTHKGMLVELLQRVTPMPVLQVKDGLRIKADTVYVIPPKSDLSLLHGVLHLIPQAGARGLNLPIDFFFRSLAADQGERAIGVILSGMGSDGTLGLRAIKESAGATFVQSPASAKFDAMPRSAIDSGLADVVAPVEELPDRIVAYREHAPSWVASKDSVEGRDQSALEKVFILLRVQTGNDFSLYKKSTISRRVERRMGLHQVDDLSQYVRYLRENPREVDLLFKELLIGVTSFFRDPKAWQSLKEAILPRVLEREGNVLRAWVAGCSTGEEAYSLAILLSELTDELKLRARPTIQIFATDLDRDAIEKARSGLFPENVVADVSPERLGRYFVREEGGFRVAKDIRTMVVFAPQNLTMDPPFTKLDILCCRNLLIYLSSEQQKRTIALFHYSLTLAGTLFLGSSETVGGFTEFFSQIDAKARTYRRLEQAMVPFAVDFPSHAIALSAGGRSDEGEERRLPGAVPGNLESLTDCLILKRFSPVGVLCNEKGDLLYVTGRAGKYLEPPVGKANLNVFAMAREGLRHEMARAFSTAVRQKRPVVTHGIRVGTNGGTQVVDLVVERLAEPQALRGTVLVVFGEAAEERARGVPPKKTRRGTEPKRIAELEEDLHRARDEAQTTREEMQTSQEELKSTNEELQSTNEELQSTNEELMTSKEEMQSLNEELQTVNQELEAKVDELSRSNNDMKNLLNSTDIATLFLDTNLHVRRFTKPTSAIIKLIPGDVGRPITDITSDLDYPGLVDDAREVLGTLAPKEKEVACKGTRWFTTRVMPYRTVDNVVDGVVITFTESTRARNQESRLRNQAHQLEQMTESLPSLVMGFGADGACTYVSGRWLEYTGGVKGELLGNGWLARVHLDERARIGEEWRRAVNAGASFDESFRLRGTTGAFRWFKVRSVPIQDAEGAVVRWYGTITDVDDLKTAELGRDQSLRHLSSVLEKIERGFLGLDTSLRVTFVNATAASILERSREEMMGKKLVDVFPEARGDVESRLARVLGTNEPSSLPGFGVGRLASLQVQAFPERDPAGISLFLGPVAAASADNGGRG